MSHDEIRHVILTDARSGLEIQGERKLTKEPRAFDKTLVVLPEGGRRDTRPVETVQQTT